ncbi:MAG: F0F1 ATP synthase subunit A [Saprospiraceae bacterium]|nr:F0F1 ATP synthase subunit A [Saprospiraceae bacterium]MBK7810648.1 F0F1 ATP synthase subunit A [Saprospiraceae bacterium]MBK9630240.1 F0F1 ATP synthase subunit A [Saprospiraceae bacterium]
MIKRYLTFFAIIVTCGLRLVSQAVDHQHDSPTYAQHEHNEHDGHDHSGHNHDGHDHSGHAHTAPANAQPHAASHDDHAEFDAKATAFHHISDLNVYNIGPWNLPLPCILYASGQGLSFFSSSKFGIDNAHHGSGHYAIDRYVLNEGKVMRIIEPTFPMGKVEIDGFATQETEVDGKKKYIDLVNYQGVPLPLEKSSTADGGIFGGGITGFYDLSISKNVFAMLLVIGLMSLVFISMARHYKRAPGTAPKGAQKLFEPIILFLQDEVAKPFLGEKYARFMPLLLAIFFFILGLNLFGQIPFLGAANVTGNLAVTMVLAILVFIVVNLNGNWHYWQHILWMPGIPAAVKIFVLTPVEILGVIIKPVTLMLRLFANITAGHMVITIFIGLIFIFGKSGESPGAAYGASIGSVLLTLFMMAIELLVAFIQAYVFTLLTASYIGAATEEHHHGHEEASH